MSRQPTQQGQIQPSAQQLQQLQPINQQLQQLLQQQNGSFQIQQINGRMVLVRDQEMVPPQIPQVGQEDVNEEIQDKGAGEQIGEQAIVNPIDYGAVENLLNHDNVGMEDEIEQRAGINIGDLVQNQATIQGQLAQIIELINDVARNNARDGQDQAEFPLLTERTPFTAVAAFLDFDRSLSDVQKKQQLTIKLRRLGGSNMDKAVRKALQILLSDNLPTEISWTGARGTVRMEGKILPSVLVDIMIRLYGSTAHEVNTVIGTWLRRAGDRIRNAACRKQRQAEQDLNPNLNN